MEVRTDLDALQKGAVVLLFLTVKGQVTAVVAQLWPVEKDGVTTLLWRETWSGERIDGLTPFAYARIPDIDPAAVAEDYA